jgi:hypothetical protein
MILRLIILTAGLLAPSGAYAADRFCLRAPDKQHASYSGCSEYTPPHADTPKVVCSDPTDPMRAAKPGANAVKNWVRAAEGAEIWCPKPEPCPQGPGACRAGPRGES